MDEPIYIYALISPLDNQVFYVGATMYPKGRLAFHKSNIQGTVSRIAKISEIKKSGKMIEMLILEQCTKLNATFLEQFYINLFCSFGFGLLQSKKSTYSKRMNIGYYTDNRKKTDKGVVLYRNGDFMGENISTTAFFNKSDKDIWGADKRFHKKYNDIIEGILIKNKVGFKRTSNYFYYP